MLQRLARFSRYWWKNPNLVEQAAEESREAIATALRDSDLAFATAGMGGGYWIRCCSSCCPEVDYL
jgi:hypothetical protein